MRSVSSRPEGRALRIGFAVNAPGIQERRAHALAGVLGDAAADVLVRPHPNQVFRLARRWDVAYVIDPGRAGFPAAVAAKAAGALTLVEVGDPQAALYRSMDRSPAEQLLGKALDALVSVGADGIIVRGPELARILNLRRRWVFVPDGVDLARFRRIDAQALRAELGIPPDALVAGVAGSVVWSERARFTYGLDLIEAASRDPARQLHVLIVGDGNGLDHLVRRASELHVSDRVRLVGRVPHDEVPRFLNAMDVCVSTQSSDQIGRGRTTAKLPEYLACDRWVLASRVGRAAEILADEMLIDADVADWAGYVSELSRRLGELATRVGHVRRNARTRAIAEREFSYSILAQRIYEFALHCVDEGRRART